MRKPTKLLPLGVALLLVLACGASAEFEFNDEFEDLIADESNVDEELLPGSVLLPSDVFNDGKPFLVERDPSTGAIDFNHKKTGNQIDLPGGSKLYDAIKDSYVSDKKDVIVHQSTPNFHDFLNLPKMYSPENFVSISSSYANLKYQGINKGGASNHQEHAGPHIVAATSATPAPTTTTTTTTTRAPPPASSTKYFYNRPQYTSSGSFNRVPYGAGSTSGNSYYKFPATSGRPITTASSTPPSTTPSTTTESPAVDAWTEAPKTTANPQKQLITRYPYKSTIKNKYLETSEQTRKKFFLPSTLALPSPTTTTSTTTSTTTTTTTTTTERPSPAATPVRTSSTYFSPSGRPHWPSAAVTTSFYQTTASPRPPAHPVVFVDEPTRVDPSKIKFTMPALKYEGSRPAPFRPMPLAAQGAAEGAPADRDREPYGTKIDLPKNPAVMSLSDIFNTLEQKKRLEAESNRVEESQTDPQEDQEQEEEQTAPPSIVLLGSSSGDQAGSGPKIEQSIDLSDQYVQYEVHPQPQPQPQPQVPLRPAGQQYPHQALHQSNGHRPQPPAMDGSQYVQYEVRQPQLNVVQYGAVPSMNSVVISPNQHSATFVLGSQQSVGTAAHAEGGHFVGSVSQDMASAAALSASRPSYQMGQVLDEPHDQTNVGTSMQVQVQVKPQDIIKTSSVRFPSESDDKYDNAPIISGTHKSEVLPPNGHSAPVRPDQMVVFPPNQDIASTLHEVSNRIVFDSPSPPTESLNQNELSIAPNPNYPADLPEQLTPPSAPSGPPGPPRPRPPVQTQGPPFRYNEIHRRPPTYPSDRPRPTLTLPNILPQFRPNAKISHGHAPYLKEPGTYRVPPSAMLVKTGPPLRKPAYAPGYEYPPSAGPVRRAPLPPTRLMARPSRPQNHPPASAELENRRHYRLPPPPPQMLKDRVFNIQPPRLQPPPPPPPSPAASSNTNIIPTGPPIRPLEKSNEPLEDSEFHRNPPQILKNMHKDERQGPPQLEPVVTLQMLQSKKQHGAPLNSAQQSHDDTTAHVMANDGVEGSGRVPVQSPVERDHPVYVVYPVKSTPVKPDDPIVLGQRGEHGPQAPVKVISPGTEYQNTPFSIASHVDQEPILTAKHKKPSAHVKLNFPYSLEKPDPLALTRTANKAGQPARHPQQDLLESDSEYNLGEEPSGAVGSFGHQDDQDLISSKLQRFHTDSTPIAIAYTPTESSVTGVAGGAAVMHGNNMRYNKPAGGYGGAGTGSNYYYSPYGETQTEVSYLKIDDVDEFGNPSRRYEQSFQAPFQASMSLDPVKVTNPYEGWAVVTSSPQALKQQQPQQPQVSPVQQPSKALDVQAHGQAQNAKNSIDRSDNGDTTATGAEDDRDGSGSALVVTPSSSGNFDPNSFQPELQGGFRPIYGADIKLSEQNNPDPQRSSVADLFAEDGHEADRGEEDGTDRPMVMQPAVTKLQLVDSKKPKPVAAVQKDEQEDEEPGMDLDLEAFFDRLTDYDDAEGGLDDVTMSDETTNETAPSSDEKEQYRAVEGRSSKGSAVAEEVSADPDSSSSSSTSSASSTSAPTSVADTEPTATTTPT